MGIHNLMIQAVKIAERRAPGQKPVVNKNTTDGFYREHGVLRYWYNDINNSSHFVVVEIKRFWDKIQFPREANRQRIYDSRKRRPYVL